MFGIERRIQALERRAREITGGRLTYSTGTWTPTVSQPGSVSVTVNYAAYTIIGNWCLGQVSLTVSGAGTSGNGIIIGGQLTAIQHSLSVASPVLGSFLLLDLGTAWYTGTVYGNSVTSWYLYAHNQSSAVGATPAFGLASGDYIALNLAYQVTV